MFFFAFPVTYNFVKFKEDTSETSVSENGQTN